MNGRYHLIVKAGLLIVISMAMTFLWYNGLDALFARIMAGMVRIFFSLTGTDTQLLVEYKDGHIGMGVYTWLDEQKIYYFQSAGAFLLPIVMVMSWQLFMVFFQDWKTAGKLSLRNIGVYLLVQFLFLLALTNRYSSQMASYFYSMLLDSFYMVALFIIFVDFIRNPAVFKRKASSEKK